MRSSPVTNETLPVCKQCHKTCLTNIDVKNDNVRKLNNNSETREVNYNIANMASEQQDDWQPLMLMGLNAASPAAALVRLDPFCTPLPQISVVPPTPESSVKNSRNPDNTPKEQMCNCQRTRPQVSFGNLYSNTKVVL